MSHSPSEALSSLLDKAVQSLQPAQVSPTVGDTYLYSGNRHETVPRQLFLDNRLTPLERNTWQIFRLLLNDHGQTAFPTYEQLRPYLSCSPCGAKASHESVAKSLTQLRLARWLSLVRRRRDLKTGYLLGNVYVLHDEPLTPYEAMQLDPEYLGLVSRGLKHANKGVQRVAVQVLKEFPEDPQLKGKVLPSRLQALIERLTANDSIAALTYPQKGAHDSEEGENHSLRKGSESTSDSEGTLEAPKSGALRNPKRLSTSRQNQKKNLRTALRNELRFPPDFTALSSAQQTAALLALERVDKPLRQSVLDEWAARCHGQTVRSREGYLFGIIQRAAQGQFKPWAGQKKDDKGRPASNGPQPKAPDPPPLKPPPNPESRARALRYIDELKSILHIP
ncbi:STY4528 family pathogenicity island replication protein [Pseudomonas sp. NPDC089401]|uniref:STY4528 family pathogenicity island replication protein n=1 Tax=Pseudomonas sp. NPDC089401 TaxID=3364462 RepID=UPI003808094A